MIEIVKTNYRPIYTWHCETCGEGSDSTQNTGAVFLIARNHARKGHKTFVSVIYDPCVGFEGVRIKDK